MSRVISSSVATLGLALALFAAAPATAEVHLYAYDPVDSLTRRVAGDLTFEFKQRLIFITILSIHSTEGQASADLRPADEKVLGHGGLNRLIGSEAPMRDLYEVEPDNEGHDLIHAFCPGSAHAWLAFSHMGAGRPLKIAVLGDGATSGEARLCETLTFNYRGEWTTPKGPGVPERDLLEPRHGPY